MKLLLLAFAGLQLGGAVPHGPDEGMATPAVLSPQNITKPLTLKGSTMTPAGCRKNAMDVDWPTLAEWKAALPGVSARPSTLAAWTLRPDYHFNAVNVADVQAAVKFSAKHNIRLTIINSG